MPGRRSAVGWSIGLLLLLGGGCGGGRPQVPAETPPHLILVTLDTTRADRLGPYGYRRAYTPTLDRLAREGTLFERAWTTTPLTTPAHASILTGLYPAVHGVRVNGHHRLAPGFETLAETLVRHGYQAAAFVGAHPLASEFGLDQGFDPYADHLGTDARGRERSERKAEEVNADALTWLHEREGSSRPLFLWVHYYDPHAPYRPPATFEPPRGLEGYDAELAYTDKQLGILLGEMKAMGFLENAVLALAGDHGEMLGQHGEPYHGMLLYEGALEVPMLFWGPGRIPEGERRTDAVSVVDIRPTLLGLCRAGLEPPAHGRDLFQAAGGEAHYPEGFPAPLRISGADRLILAESLAPWKDFGWSPLFAVRRGDQKIIEGARWEAYDLSRDAEESRPDGLPSRVREELRARLHGLQPALEEMGGADSEHAVDAETLERLRSLGYVALGAGPSEGGGPWESRGGRDPAESMGLYREYQAALDAYSQGGSGCHRAHGAIQAVLNRDPDNRGFRFLKAEVLVCVRDLAGAEAVLRGLLTEEPENVLVLRKLAETLRKDGRAGEAVELLAAFEEGPLGPLLREDLLKALREDGREEEILRLCSDGETRFGCPVLRGD